MFKSKHFLVLFSLLFLVGNAWSQSDELAQSLEKENKASVEPGELVLIVSPFMGKGNLSLGLRSTASLFNSDGGFGSGVGGQFRLQLSDRINTEWFADLITTNLSDAGRRTDAHIGWSVMFYPIRTNGYQTSKLMPYILAGHCFDYTKISAFSNPGANLSNESDDRWSSAVQLGLGSHFRLSERFDFSVSAQYMLHLGNDIHAHVEDNNGGYPTLEIEEHDGASLEGHLLLTFSINYILADLW